MKQSKIERVIRSMARWFPLRTYEGTGRCDVCKHYAKGFVHLTNYPNWQQTKHFLEWRNEHWDQQWKQLCPKCWEMWRSQNMVHLVAVELMR